MGEWVDPTYGWDRRVGMRWRAGGVGGGVSNQADRRGGERAQTTAMRAQAASGGYTSGVAGRHGRKRWECDRRQTLVLALHICAAFPYRRQPFYYIEAFSNSTSTHWLYLTLCAPLRLWKPTNMRTSAMPRLVYETIAWHPENLTPQPSDTWASRFRRQWLGTST
jgi:hypothetical protein